MKFVYTDSILDIFKDRYSEITIDVVDGILYDYAKGTIDDLESHISDTLGSVVMFYETESDEDGTWIEDEVYALFEELGIKVFED